MVATGTVERLTAELSAETGATIMIALRNRIYAQYDHVIQATNNTLRLHTPTGNQPLTRMVGRGLCASARCSR